MVNENASLMEIVITLILHTLPACLLACPYCVVVNISVISCVTRYLFYWKFCFLVMQIEMLKQNLSYPVNRYNTNTTGLFTLSMG